MSRPCRSRDRMKKRRVFTLRVNTRRSGCVFELDVLNQDNDNDQHDENAQPDFFLIGERLAVSFSVIGKVLQKFGTETGVYSEKCL